MLSEPRTAELSAAYLQTIYQVKFERRSVRLHLDRSNVGLATALHQNRSSWALVGAVNPMSRTYPVKHNQFRQRELERALRRRKAVFFPASGLAPDGSWHEPAVWIVDQTHQLAEMLGYRYAQAAIVIGQGQLPGRLRWLI